MAGHPICQISLPCTRPRENISPGVAECRQAKSLPKVMVQLSKATISSYCDTSARVIMLPPAAQVFQASFDAVASFLVGIG